MTDIGSRSGTRQPRSGHGEGGAASSEARRRIRREHIKPRHVSPVLSVIIPTRNEAGNIAQLLRRIEPVAAGHPQLQPFEVIFVDDSTDDTPEVIQLSRDAYRWPIRLIHRPPERRVGGLGGAVLEGMRAAEGTWMVVMDGDLQHPPELIPDLLRQAEQGPCDLVVASRYCADGSASSFNRIRSFVSQGSTMAAKALFPIRLRHVNDPMSGFFLVRRGALDLETLRPNGFKILLEIVARTPGLRIGSVPFSFGERYAGRSKASLREGFRYLQLLGMLRLGPSVTRFGQFGLVGISGLVVNSLLLALFTETFGIYYLISLLLATQGSSLWNFYLSEYWVFRRSELTRSRLYRGAFFLLMNNVALLARAPIVYVLTSMLGVNYLISNVISMVVLLVLRFAIADSVIWRSPSTQPAVPQAPLPGIAQDQEVAA
ncbi:MAG: glycosyltransferase family 2 protein [Thermomicrobiales bacterium]